MKRHVDELMAKARTHLVYSNKAGTEFLVKSSESGVVYTVSTEDGVNYVCNCEWTLHNPGSRCSHSLAAQIF